MRTLTFFGVAGGVGTTTMTVLTASMLRSLIGETPSVLAADPHALKAALGNQLSEPSPHGHTVIDGALWSESSMAEAISDGAVAIVTPATQIGLAMGDALEERISKLQASGERVLWVSTGAHGGMIRARDTSVAHIPFDPCLCLVPSVSDALPLLRKKTRLALEQWMETVRSAMS